MSESNGQEPKKPKVQIALTREDESGLNIPSWLLEEPDRWIDGMRFVLRRRLANAWELSLESSPALIEATEASQGLSERG